MNLGNHSRRAARPIGRCPFCETERRSTRRCGAVCARHRPSSPRGPLQPAERVRGTVRMTARVLRPSVDVANGAGHARAEGPEGSGGRPVESPACIASIALDVSVYRSTASAVCAVREDGGREAGVGGAGRPDAQKAIATEQASAPSESMPGTCWMPTPEVAEATGVRLPPRA